MAQKKIKRHPGAIKANRQALRRNLRNRFVKKGIRTAARAVLDAALAKDSGKTTELTARSSSAFDKAAQGGVIHWKTAARRKSRLAKRAAAQLAAAK